MQGDLIEGILVTPGEECLTVFAVVRTTERYAEGKLDIDVVGVYSDKGRACEELYSAAARFKRLLDLNSLRTVRAVTEDARVTITEARQASFSTTTKVSRTVFKLIEDLQTNTPGRVQRNYGADDETNAY